ncbi:T3SS (YopN, CesT) and YbjN peptide-binding chaperone 1 [Sorangium sp. So ce1182]|uniref:T3SS (YopN, CesT) and YbjN peptide-binding chaperone 1 n=1 Tax=Sorangium sp. So ce1182 TaxID=3133334 RepID=UPI003F5DEAE8
MPKDSDAAVQVTNARIEAALADSPAFTRVEPHFYVVRQGTAYVYLHVLPWAPDRALVRLVAQLARGVEMTPDLAMKLLRLNARIRFGAFGYVAQGSCVVIVHTLLGGETLDAEELLVALRDLSVLADEYDDRIVEEAGGQRMQDLIDASATAAVFTDLDPVPRAWDKG